MPKVCTVPVQTHHTPTHRGAWHFVRYVYAQRTMLFHSTAWYAHSTILSAGTAAWERAPPYSVCCLPARPPARPPTYQKHGASCCTAHEPATFGIEVCVSTHACVDVGCLLVHVRIRVRVCVCVCLRVSDDANGVSLHAVIVANMEYQSYISASEATFRRVLFQVEDSNIDPNGRVCRCALHTWLRACTLPHQHTTATLYTALQSVPAQLNRVWCTRTTIILITTQITLWSTTPY